MHNLFGKNLYFLTDRISLSIQYKGHIFWKLQGNGQKVFERRDKNQGQTTREKEGRLLKGITLRKYPGYGYLWISFSFKMHSEEYIDAKTQIFSHRPFVHLLLLKFLSKWSYSNKPLLPWKTPGWSTNLVGWH